MITQRPDGGDEQQDQDDERQAYGFSDQEFFKLKIWRSRDDM